MEYSDTYKAINAYEAEIKRLREALAWYADENNWVSLPFDATGFVPTDDDMGLLARNALKPPSERPDDESSKKV